MTFVSEPVEPPRWVITFPDVLPPEAIARIREQAKAAIDSDAPVIVLEGGATMYDARYGPPPVTAELEALSAFDVPLWMTLALLVITVAAVICAVAAVVLVVAR